ncbi:MAG: ribosome recycling factor [bacterium]
MPIKGVLRDAEDRMKKSVVALQQSYLTVRSGKASVQMLDGIRVDYYGTMTPLNQIASVSSPEAHLLVVQPWDKEAVDGIVKALQTSDLGLNPQVDGQIIRLPIPALTEERRKDLVKIVKKMAEEAKVAVRNIRRDANEALKKLEKSKEVSEDQHADGEEEVQTLTNDYIDKIDASALDKENEVMQV